MITSFFAPKKRKGTPSKEGPSHSARTEPSLSPDSAALAGNNGSTDTNANANANKRLKAGASEDNAVQQILQYLKDNSTQDTCSWRKALDKHFKSKRFETLARFVASQRISNTVYPHPEDVFSALTLTPMDQVKVVIVGQDPYHGPNQGHGLCFSVRKGIQVPPSLKNIYKELKNDPNVEFPKDGEPMPTHGYLEQWARQGVLMLNAVLTVRKGEANSHKKKGWEDVTDEILRALARDRKASGKGLVYLLWGKPASQKIDSVLGGPKDNKTRKIITTSHPSPLGATKTSSPFMGSKCFSRANDALAEMDMEPIDWNVDGKVQDQNAAAVPLVDV